MDQRTRKLMTMHKVLHPVMKLTCVKKGVRKRTCQHRRHSVDASIQRLEVDIEKQEGGLITAIRNDADNTKTNKITITRKQKWEAKQHFGRFKQLISNISSEKT